MQAAKKNPFAAALNSHQKLKQQETESEPPTLPASARYAWAYFLRLHQTRQQGGFGGFSMITYQEMLAFFTLEQVFPETYELELIRVWDMVARQKFEEQEKQKTKKPK